MLRRIAVTGGRGFIGAAVRRQLRDVADVVTIDLPVHDVRTLEPGALDGCHNVIHLAGMLGTAELFDSVTPAIMTNTAGTAQVLKAAQAAGAGYTGITMPRVFPSVYQATKTGARELERAWHYSFGLPVSRVRAFNAYGPGQKHGPGHPAKIVPVFATEAWAGRPIPIWGDGEQLVDLIHVDDLARLLVEATRHGDDFTLDGGTGTSMAVGKVAQLVLDITGSAAGVVHKPMRPGEIARKHPQADPGWEPIVATGEGWERLDWQPSFDREAFARAVESYRGHGA